jgi:transcriptional regulator with XRE-family HTH domain
MLDGKLSAAEVARRVWGTSTDKRGYEVAKNRDRIGHYLAGTSYPEPENLQKLADAVNVPVDKLAIAERPRPLLTRPPRSVKETIAELQPENIQIFLIGDGLEMAALTMIKRPMRTELAMQIIKLLREDENAGIDPANPMRIKLPDTA